MRLETGNGSGNGIANENGIYDHLQKHPGQRRLLLILNENMGAYHKNHASISRQAFPVKL
jgi:hypothetical protein